MANNDNIRKRLLQCYLPETEGEWEIYGEDPNTDLGGHHSNPFLGKVSGRYCDVVEYALTKGDFVGWGYGGNITKVKSALITVPRGFSADSLKDLYTKKAQLETELKMIEGKIRNLDVDYE